MNTKQEVRQFTEAGIPLIQLLAEKFTELNGEMTTTGDVFQLISERAVPFEMVKEVFEDMTNAGGIFYDMQAKQANTLYGIYSNLRDAWDVAFNEIGQENLGLMKGIGNAITDLGENWRVLESVLSTAAFALGSYKIAMMAAAIATRQKTSSIMAEIAAERVRLITLAASTNATKADILANEAMAAQSTKTLYLKTRLANANNILTKSYYRLRLASMATVWGLVAAAIGAAVYAIYRYVNAESDVVRMQRKVSEYAIEQKSAFDSSSNSLDYLMTKLKKASKGSQEYASIIGEINKRYASFLPEQLKVSQSYEQVAISIGKVKKALEEKAKAESYSAGIRSIETDYGGKMKDAYEKAMKSLTTSGFAGYSQFVFSEEQARDLWTTIVDTLKSSEGKSKSEKDIRKLIQDTFNKAVSEKGIDTSKLDMSIENYPQLKGFREGIVDVSSAIRDLQVNTENFDKVQSATFGSNKAPTFAERLKEIELYSKSAMESLDSLSFSDKLEYKQEVHKLNVQRLEDIISLYKEFNQFDMVKKYQTELEALKGISKGWQNIIRNLVADSEGVSMNFLLPTEDENAIFTYIDRVKKKYKELTDQISILEGTQGKVGVNIDDNGKELSKLKSQLDGLLKVSSKLRIDLSDNKKTGGSKKDPRIESLEAEIKLIKEVYSRYQELSKVLTESDARAEIEKAYGSIKPASLKFAFNDEELKAQYREFLARMKTLGVKDAITQKYKLELSDIDFKRFQDSLKAKIKKLGDDLEKQQKANKFFEKIIGAGMDAQIAASITMNLYGFDSSDIRQTMINSLEEGMGGIKLDLTPEGTIDFSKVAERIKSNELLSPDLKDAYLDLANSIRDNDAETIDSLYSNLNKYSEYEQRRLDILNRASDERKKIQSSAVADSMKGDLIAQSRKKESKDLATLEYDIFKESDLYATMFENLDKVSTASLDAIRSKLEAFKQSNIENLDPTQIRELTRSFENVDEQFRARNPFQSMIVSIGQYKDQAKAASDANKEIVKINNELKNSELALAIARNKANQAISSGEDASIHEASVNAISSTIKQLEKQLGLQIKITNEAKRTKDMLAEAATGLGDKLGGVESSIGSFGETLGILGVDMDSELGATFGDLENVIGGAAEAAGGFGKVMKGDLSGIGDMIKGTGKQIQGFVGLFTGINRKVAKANKEIKKQAEIIRGLESQYRKLEVAINDAMGSDFVAANAKQLKNLEAQISATQKQLEAEKSKGKKKDNDRIAEYEQQIIELQERIVERQKAFTEQMLATNVGDAARSFASAWLDAYLAFENTTEAIESKFKDMLKNMLIEAILGKVIQEYVSKMFEQVGDIWDRQVDFRREAGDKMVQSDIDWLMANQEKWMPKFDKGRPYDYQKEIDKIKNALDSDVYSQSMIDALTKAGIYTEEQVSLNKDKLQELLSGANSWAEGLNDLLLEAMDGIDISGLQDLSDTSLTGISKAVGSLSEETALTLAAAANSSLYYNIGQYNELVMIHEILTRWDAERSVVIQGTDTSSGVSGLIAVQNLALDELRKANISLEDIMESNREIQEFFVSLTSPLGSRSGTRAINVNI